MGGVARRRNWSHAEDDYLRDNYGKLSFEQIGAALKRSTMGVSCRATKLKLFKPTISGEQRKFVIDNYHKVPAGVLAAQVGCSVHTVYKMAKYAHKQTPKEPTSICGDCSKATPAACPFMRAGTGRAAAVLGSIGAKFTGSRKLLRVTECPDYEKGALMPLSRRVNG